MFETENNLYEVHVWFVVEPETTRFYFFGDVETSEGDPQVRVAAGLQLIRMDLRTAAAAVPLGPQPTQEELMALEVGPEFQAEFVSDPIQWVAGNNRPLDTPTGIQVNRIAGSRCELLDCNTTVPGETVSFPMRLIVMHGGSIAWTPDPTIINLPPNPPGTEGQSPPLGS